jgi:DNA repair exonuclease SbcCD ATPase subunit
MRITTLRLMNFKRFTDLTIAGIPETARLVLVVGPNGSGKSSLFDAFLQWHRSKAGFGFDGDESYYRKDKTSQFDWNQVAEVDLAGVNRPGIAGGLLV